MLGRFRGMIRRMFYNGGQTEHVHEQGAYPNWGAHPERQSLDTDGGFRSVLLKQLETNERLLRALIEIERNKK